MDRAKGFEFKAVIVLGCEEKLLPMRALLDRLSDPADRDAFIEQEKAVARWRTTVTYIRLIDDTYAGGSIGRQHLRKPVMNNPKPPANPTYEIVDGSGVTEDGSGATTVRVRGVTKTHELSQPSQGVPVGGLQTNLRIVHLAASRWWCHRCRLRRCPQPSGGFAWLSGFGAH
jgi:hypothetical protein